MSDETLGALMDRLESIDRKLGIIAAAIVAAKADEGERADLDMFLDGVRDAGAVIAARGRDDEALNALGETLRGGER